MYKYMKIFGPKKDEVHEQFGILTNFTIHKVT
jgi:hypothetical protein